MSIYNTLDIKILNEESRANYLLKLFLAYSFNKNYIFNNLELLKVHDSITYIHALNVAKSSLIIGANMDMKDADLHMLCDSALMHDIGKVFINRELLNKDEPLTGHEFDIIKKHTLLGYDYLKYNMQGDAARGALEHHERIDGSGYPKGIKGKNISIYGRIIAIADVYDAITAERPYKEAKKPATAIKFISDNATTLFDNDIVLKFREISGILNKI